MPVPVDNSLSDRSPSDAAKPLLFLPPEACFIDEIPTGPEIAFSGSAFGTSWSLRAFTQRGTTRSAALAAQTALQGECQRALDLIDRQMSPWIGDSDLSRYNRLATGERARLPEPMRALVASSMSLCDLTGGAFDPFVGGITAIWGFGPDAVGMGLPGAASVAELQAGRSTRRPVLDGDVLERQAGHALDLCGIAKGYAVDLLLDAVIDLPCVSSALVEIGGELKGQGIKPDSMPWWVDLDWAGKVPMRVALHGWACASSGSDVRFFDHGGRRYSHTMAPDRAEPVDNDLRGVTVFDRHCWRADALATALLVLGMDEGLAFADRHQIACILVPETGRPRLSDAMTGWLGDG